jgi:ribosomal protein S27AE
MTIRESLDRKRRKASIIAFASWLVFVAAGVLTSEYSPAIILAIPAFIVFMASVVYLVFGIRCPRCGGIMGYVLIYSSGPFSISRKINYCPHCGQDINKEVADL